MTANIKLIFAILDYINIVLREKNATNKAVHLTKEQLSNGPSHRLTSLVTQENINEHVARLIHAGYLIGHIWDGANADIVFPRVL